MKMRRTGPYLPLAAVLAFGRGAACTSNDNRAANQGAAASPSPSPGMYADSDTIRDDDPDAGDIAGNPTKYDGQRVTFKADVKKVMPNGFFELEDDLLVLSPAGQPREKEKVTITGTVQTYSAPQLKSRYSWFKSDRDVDERYMNRAVIVADSIMTADGREVVSSPGLPAATGEIDEPKAGAPQPDATKGGGSR
jgi:hypothetical protein